MKSITWKTLLPQKISYHLKKLLLTNRKMSVFLVGGYLRDYFLNRNNPDLDIIVFNYSAEKFARKLGKLLGARIVKLDDFNQIYRLIIPEKNKIHQIDISQPKGKNLLEDLSQRDFTINALAVKLSPVKLELIDYYNSRKDITNGIIQLISPKCFQDDPLRMLRAFRFMAQLNFRLTKKTYQEIKKHARLIRRSARERIAEELRQIFLSKHSAILIELISECGLLEKIIPEISSLKNSGRSYYFHPHGLWQHTYQTLESLEYFLLRRKKLGFTEEISPEEIFALKLAAIFHDCGKPKTKKVIAGRVRFWQHEKYGEKLAGKALRKLCLSNHIIRLVQKLVYYHMRPINLSSASVITARAAWRLYQDVGPAFPLLLILTVADCYSYRNLPMFKPKQFQKQLKTIKTLLKYYKKFTAPSQPKLVDGHLIMREFNLSPGPVVGKILKMIAEAQATGKIHTAREAINYIRKKIKNNLL